jgi:23S rRNA pseudoU1915 N3-methylase RlmH
MSNKADNLAWDRYMTINKELDEREKELKHELSKVEDEREENKQFIDEYENASHQKQLKKHIKDKKLISYLKLHAKEATYYKFEEIPHRLLVDQLLLRIWTGGFSSSGWRVLMRFLPLAFELHKKRQDKDFDHNYWNEEL